MARRQASRLLPGTTLADYSSPARIRSALGTESAIRAEYSRQRSIIRKRVERLAKAGETSNAFYQRFGNLAEALPTAKGMSTKDMMQRMAASARALSGAYTSTLKGILQQRKEMSERIAKQARERGDIQTADFLESGKLTGRQEMKIKRVWKIVRAVAGKSIGYALGSGDIDDQIAEAVTGGGSKQSALSIASQILTAMDADTQDLERAKKQFTKEGKVRVAWTREQRKKGKK